MQHEIQIWTATLGFLSDVVKLRAEGSLRYHDRERHENVA